MATRIYATLNFPTVTSHPSSGCIQWTAEGQLIFVTKSAAYVLTPDYGITHDNASAIKSEHKNDDQNDIGWFRTIVQFDAGAPFKWPEYSQEWGAVSFGSIDLSLWAVAISPSNLSTTSGCIIATLSSNLDLILWTAARNSLKGEWVKVCDITPYLLKSVETTADLSQTAQALHAQVISICWTPYPDFNITPVPSCNGSLLIAGNRAGGIVLLRYLDETVELVNTIPLGDYWIVNIAFSRWTLSETGKTSGILAYGNSAGAVGLVAVTQELVEQPVPFFVPQYAIETTVQDLGLVYEPDKASITDMRWVIPPARTPILVVSKPGRLLLWSEPEENSSWSGLRVLVLKTQKIHKSSSSFHLATGLNYVQSRDILVLTLADGSFHIVEKVSSDPSWSNTDINSLGVSRAARSIFVETRKGDVDSIDMNKITGVASFDDKSTIMWTQEAMRPSDFSYKHEAKHSSCLVVTQLWDEEQSDDLLLGNLQSVLDETIASSGYGPLHLLRPYFFQLNDKAKINELQPRILQILSPSLEDHSLTINIPSFDLPLTDQVRRRLRESLSRHLFGYDALVSLRMRLAFADFTWKLLNSEDKRHECGIVAQNLLNAISYRSVRTIIRHLGAAVSLLQDDVPFILRTVYRTLLVGSPEDLTSEARTLWQRVQTLLSLGATESTDLIDAEEHCPACSVIISLNDVTKAVCSNGHHWARCSITTFILCTPHVRTCIGCSRKAFLPLSSKNSPDQPSWLPPLARGWVVEELLESVKRCLYCNNSFVRVL